MRQQAALKLIQMRQTHLLFSKIVLQKYYIHFLMECTNLFGMYKEKKSLKAANIKWLHVAESSQENKSVD